MLLLVLALALQAGDPQLRTDHPHYPGEGAMSTPAKCLQTAWTTPRGSLGSATNREKMIRLFLWRAETYTHLFSPAVYNLPGRTPKPTSDDPLMTDYDAMRGLFSYGWGLCGTNHGQMRVFADAQGWNSRRRGLQGDTGYEIFVDAGWRYFNTDQYTLHFLANDPAAHFASVDQVVTTPHRYIEWNPDLGLGYRLPQANTHGNYQDVAGVTGTVANRARQWRDYYGGVWDILPADSKPMYGEGYTATPIVVRLKRGETFTRWLAPTGAQTELGLAGPAWWGRDGAAPHAEHSFVQNAPARDETPGGAEESDGNSRHGNVCYDWAPNLAAGEHLDGRIASTGTLTSGGTPTLAASGAATLTLLQYTPYTIAGRPVGGTDPAEAALDGAVLRADAVGSVAVDVSVNAGATWTSIGTLAGAGAAIDFTNAVKGRNQYLLRLSFDGGEGLNSLRLRTLGMMNQGVYPNLKSGTASVSYSAAHVGGLELSPDLFDATSANSTSGLVQKVGDSGNLNATHYSSSWAYESTNSQPISTTWRITLPIAGAAWKRIFAAGDFSAPVNAPPGDPRFGKIEISPDNAVWTTIADYTVPQDNDLSHFWAYGASPEASTLGGTTYYVRYTTRNGGYPSRIRFLRLAATYTTAPSTAPLEVTYHWNNGAETSHAHTVAAGAASDAWSIPTGTVAAQRKVVMKVGVSAGGGGSAPVITTQPVSQTIAAGGSATFTVGATGATMYQWQLNGTDVPGATSASLTASAAGTYTVVVSNASGSATSQPATLTVTAPGGGGGTPVVATLTGVEDTYLDQFDPAAAFGNLDRMESRWFDDGMGLSEHMQALFRFDLSSIPAGATVTSAVLTLHNTRAAANGASETMTLGRVTSAWTEAHTWNLGAPSSVPSGVTLPSVASLTQLPPSPEPYVVPGLEALAQGWVDAPASNLGLILTASSNLNLRFATSEHATTTVRPKLEVTYTTAAAPPPPATPPPSSPPPPAAGAGLDSEEGTCGCGSTVRAPLPPAWLLAPFLLLILRRRARST